MTEKSQTIYLPEAGQPVIDALGAHNTTGYDVEVGSLPLLSENGQPGALEKLVAGEFAAVIAGARYKSADVVSAGIEVIGTEDGLVSSFFAMESKESDSQERIFLADCAVVPAPDKEKLAKIAARTCENVEKLGVTPVVAFLSSPGEGSARYGDVVRDTVSLFETQNPGRASIGEVQWNEAKDEALYEARTGRRWPGGSRPNVLIFPSLDSGNIVYKILQDPDGSGWKTAETRPHSYVMEKDGRQLVLSNCGERHTPNSRELVELAEQTCEGVEDPVVAFLSFSTEGSSTRPEAKEVQDAANEFRNRHPGITTYGEIQWDSARNEAIYELKTGKQFTGGKAPNVFIFPNRDSGSIAYMALQDRGAGGMTAIGPMLQGFKKGILLIDLSRGVDEEAGIGIIKLTGQLAGLQPEEKPQEPPQAEPLAA
jgi:phosphotransacetylase